MVKLDALIVQAIDRASRSMDVLSQGQLATVARRHTLARWKFKTVAKVTGVGLLTGMPGGLFGGLLAALDLTYLFAAAGRGCYGIGYILGREVDRERDLPLILACWCGAASVVPTAAAGKVAVKVFGKVALPVAATLGTRIVAKAALKGGGKFLGKLAPQIAAKVAGQLAGKAGASYVPLVGGVVSSTISYWVADSLMQAAERYYQHDYVQFDDPGLTLEDVIGGLTDIGFSGLSQG